MAVAGAWHALSPDEVLGRLGTDPEVGLTTEEAERRLLTWGPNALPEPPPAPFWKRLLAQLRSFVVLLLILAVAISAFLGQWVDAAAILAIVVLNAAIGAAQETGAERALRSLKRMAAPVADVLRDGRRMTVPAATLVPGDIVVLGPGSIVPADLRLIETALLRVDESSLTGESVPVEKDADAVLEAETPLAERTNCAFMGTTVVYGRGRGVVVATGLRTELGKIAELTGERTEETPLQRRLEEFGKTLGTLVVLMSAGILVIKVVRESNFELVFQAGLQAYLTAASPRLVEFFILAVSLAVAAVPEGLPTIVTLTLTVGVREMLRRNVLVRRLPAVETLGTATVIATDKTGTLTQNQMTVVRVWTAAGDHEVTGHGYSPTGEFRLGGVRVDPSAHPVLYQTLWAGLLCNDAELVPDRPYRVIGDPTEGALVVAAAKAGLQQDLREAFPRTYEFPFDSDRKRMTTIHPTNGTFWNGEADYVALVKGAPDVVLGLCTRIQAPAGPVELDEGSRRRVEAAYETMAAEGLRVLAVAYRLLSHVPEGSRPEEVEADLVLLGLFGMQDPPRPEVPDALRRAARAGVRTVMVTGDHVATATAVARLVGLIRPGGRVLTGRELDRMGADLRELIEEVDVFARVSPYHKVLIVDALQARGHIVAVTGDGVNDAPALNRADIGIAMGIAGTDVAKDAADLVLVDDNYASIVAGLEQGRVIYANIRKAVYYLLSCNFAEVATIFLATLAGWPAPLSPTQLLLINLVTDGGPALALGLEKGEPGIMERPPRPPKEPLISREAGTRVGLQAAAITATVLGVYLAALGSSWAASAGTMAFATLTLAEVWRAYASRSEDEPLHRVGLLSNPWMQAAALGSVSLLLLAVSVPFLNPVFHTRPLSWEQWAVVVPASFIPALAAEARKILRTRPFLV